MMDANNKLKQQMKNTIIILSLISIVFTLSCTKDIGTEIIISVSSTDLIVGNEIILEAENEMGEDISADVNFHVNDVKIKESNFIAEEEIAHAIYAEYDGLVSNTITINPYKLAPDSYEKKLFVEEFGATWCGYCPHLVSAITKAKEDLSSELVVVTHQASGDFSSEYFDYLFKEKYEMSGMPQTVIEGVEKEWAFAGTLRKYEDETPSVGMSLSTKMTASDYDVKLTIGMGKELPSAIAYTIYLVESNIVVPQSNFDNEEVDSPFFSLGNPIEDFVHDNVLRECITDIDGDQVPEDKIKENRIYELSISRAFPSSILDRNNLKVIAVAWEGEKAINAQQVELGGKISYN